MKFRPLARCLLGLSLVAGAFALTPTEVREWTSTTGSQITAKALELTPNGSVELETKDGRKLTLSLDDFTKVDQDFLEKHFRKDETKPGPQESTGEHRGPIKADADTSYFLYIPKDLDKSVRAPVMIWTQSDGGKADTLERFDEAADLLGMIIATPVEARNEGQVTLINNATHTKDVLQQLRKNFSINRESIHFGGDESGAAAAFYNSLKNKSAGTFTVSGYLTSEMTGGNEGHHFMAGGTTSSNRYLTAWSAAKFGESGTHFLYSGGRDMPEEKDVTTGMIWMYSQGLYEDIASRTEEAAGFQKRILPWLMQKAESSPDEAAYLTRTLSEECTLRGSFKSQIKRLESRLGKDQGAVAYVKAREALDKFSEDEMSKYGNNYAPLKEHAPKKFERMTKRLAEKNAGAGSLKPIFKELAEPTHR